MPIICSRDRGGGGEGRGGGAVLSRIVTWHVVGSLESGPRENMYACM